MPNLASLFCLSVALILYLAYGTLINDLTDREIDISVGKFSASRGHHNTKRQLIATLLVQLCLIIFLIFLSDRGVVYDLVWAAALFLATAYSLPPLKLKVRGILGFITDSVIEKPLPILIVFAFFGYYGFEVILFPIFGELLDSIFKHQTEDIELDAKLGIRSFAVQLGKSRSTWGVRKLAHPLNLIASVSFLMIAFVELPKVRWLVAVTSIMIILGAIVVLFLEQKGKVSEGFPFPEPPLLGFLNFGLRTLFLAALCIGASLNHLSLLPFAALVFFSIGFYLFFYKSYFAGFFHYVMQRWTTVAPQTIPKT